MTKRQLPKIKLENYSIKEPTGSFFYAPKKGGEQYDT